ncbi:hypothetical protein D9M69_609660 [compost metagenome]
MERSRQHVHGRRLALRAIVEPVGLGADIHGLPLDLQAGCANLLDQVLDTADKAVEALGHLRRFVIALDLQASRQVGLAAGNIAQTRRGVVDRRNQHFGQCYAAQPENHHQNTAEQRDHPQQMPGTGADFAALDQADIGPAQRLRLIHTGVVVFAIQPHVIKTWRLAGEKLVPITQACQCLETVCGMHGVG